MTARKKKVTKRTKDAIIKLKKENKELKDVLDLNEDLDLDDDLTNDEELKTNAKEKEMFDFTSDEEEIGHNDRQEISAIDIFEYGVKLAEETGIYPEWTIKRNGSIVATKRSRYSFEKLQLEHGGGHYEIWLKDGTTKKYIKKMTTDVEDPPLKEDKEERMHIPQQTNQQPSMAEMLALITQITSNASKEKAEVSRATTETQALSNQMLVQSLKQIAEQNSTNMNMTMKMMQQMQDNTNKMFESLSKNTNKKDEFGIKEMLLLMNQTKADAAKEMREQMKIAREIMEERLGAGTGDKEKSMTDKLIETALPALPALMQSLSQPRAQPQFIPQSIERPRPDQQNGSPYRDQSMERDIRSRSASNFNKPKAPDLSKPPQSKPIDLARPKENVENLKTINTLGDLQMVENKGEIKQAILDVAMPLATDSMLNRKSAQDSGRNTVKALLEKGITKEEIIANFTEDDTINIGKQYNLPKIALSWLKDYYAEIKVECSRKSIKTDDGKIAQGINA